MSARLLDRLKEALVLLEVDDLEREVVVQVEQSMMLSSISLDQLAIGLGMSKIGILFLGLLF